jgi:hypothetical protein
MKKYTIDKYGFNAILGDKGDKLSIKEIEKTIEQAKKANRNYERMGGGQTSFWIDKEDLIELRRLSKLEDRGIGSMLRWIVRNYIDSVR